MGFWSGIFKATSGAIGRHKGAATGITRGEDGWQYEESRDFSKSQSTIRINQQRPGEWKIVHPSCGIAGLNETARRDGVARFFAGSYRWLQLERGVDKVSGEKTVKVIGTFRLKASESAVHLGFLGQELVEELEGENIRSLWGKIRFIKFPSPGRSSGYLIRFDLMKKQGNGESSGMVK
jgi:hypothetical protein